MSKLLRIDSKLMTRNSNILTSVDYVPTPVDYMDFIYLANDFDGTQVANRANNTAIGASNKGPVLCFSIGRGTSNNSVNHEGTCTIVGVKR